jgi:hypothetical protein
MAAADIVPRLCLRTSTRRAPPAATPLFLTSVPAGTYLLEPAVAYAAGYRTIEVRIGRSARPIQQWEVNGSQAAGAMLVRLPLGVTALTVSGAQTPGRAAGMLALRPLAGRREPPFPNPGNPDVGQLASRAARYGSVVVLAFTQLVFLEEQGFWMMAGRDDCIVVAPDEPTGRVTLLARNGPYPNVVTLATRDWNARLELASREERELDVPLDRASGAVVLQVHAEKGFRPSDVEPGSRDDRDLGVWFEVVTPSTREMTSVIPHF